MGAGGTIGFIRFNVFGIRDLSRRLLDEISGDGI